VARKNERTTRKENDASEQSSLVRPSTPVEPRSASAIQVGDRLLDDRYRVLRLLGHGGMGVVYEAFDAVQGMQVALKTLSRVDATSIYRLKNEFRSVASLAHENLVQLYELHADSGRWFFTMSLVDGVPFTEYVRENSDVAFERTTAANAAWNAAEDQTVRGGVLARDRGAGALRERSLRSTLRQLALGVDVIHRAGKLHRDLKPSNVLVSRAGRVVILDFGLMSEHSGDAIGQTLVDREIAGTPAYMAPEQARGERTTQAGDWYSVGVMLFQALTGELPFEGSSHEMMNRKLSTDAPRPSSLYPSLPADLDQLCSDLLHRSPEQRPTGEQVLARISAGNERLSVASAPSPDAFRSSRPEQRRSAVFVGRAVELGELRACLHSTDDGAPIVVLVAGESGMGKTALVERFIEETRANEDVVVLAGRCYEREAVPYKAFDGVIDALSRLLRRLPPVGVAQLIPRNVHVLVRLFPVLGRVEAIAGARQRAPLPADPLELRRRGIGAFKEILSRIGDARRVIVSIDDLQWGDLDSVKLLRELCAPPEPPAVLLIGTYRNDEPVPSPFLTELFNAERGLRDVEVRTLLLEPLSEAEVAELVQARDGGSLDIRAIQREAQGSPYFVNELIRHAKARDGADRPREVKLEKALQWRLSDLPSAAHFLLKAIAVAGHPIDRATAAAAAGLDAAAVSDAVETLRAAGLVRTLTVARDTGGSSTLFTTYHDRVREAITARLSDADRRGWHRSLVMALEASGHDDPETLSHHYLEAGDHARAGSLAVEAARRASNILAFERAATLYRIALDHSVDQTERARLLLLLGEVLINAGRNADAARALLEASNLSDQAEATMLTSRAGAHLLLAGHIEEGRAILDEVLAGYGIVIPSDLLQATQQAANLQYRLEQRTLAFQERAKDEVPEANLRRVDVISAATLGLATVLVGPHHNILIHQHLLAALELGEPARVLRALGLRCLVAGRPEFWEGASTMLQVMTALAARLATNDADAWLELATGALQVWQGRAPQGASHLIRADELWSEGCIGVAREQSTTRLFLGSALGVCGRVGLAGRLTRRWAKDAEDRNDLFLAVRCGTQSHMSWLPLDEPARAMADVQTALARWRRPVFDHVVWTGHLVRAMIELYSGSGWRAWDILSEHWEQFLGNILAAVPVFRYQAFSQRGYFALGAAAQSQNAEPLLRVAADCAAECSSLNLPISEPDAHVLRGGIAELRGAQDEATEHYARGAALFQSVNPLNASIAAARRGHLLGGDEGRELIASAHTVLSTEGIKKPENWMRLVTPASLKD
jgi:eukaryotic-like serine/threonine-protein kinase